MTGSLPAVLDRIEAGLEATRARWFELLRIPSVSAQPTHAADCGRAAEWLRAELAAIGFDGQGAAHGRAPGRTGPPRGHGARPAPALLRPLRRAAGRAVRAVDHPAVRARDDGGAARAAHLRPGCGGRQGAGHDVAAGPARLARDGRRPALPGDGADRGRGGGGQPQPRAVPGRAQGRVGGGHRHHQRHRHVGHRHPGRDHAAARHGVCRADAARGGAGPALRGVRRHGAEPDQRADPHPGRPARCRGPHPAPRLLRRRGRHPARVAGGVDVARLRRRRAPGWHRALGARRRARPGAAGADVGAPDRRHQRHLGRLHRRRQQDGDRGAGLGQGLLPPGPGPGPGGGVRGLQALRVRAHPGRRPGRVHPVRQRTRASRSRPTASGWPRPATRWPTNMAGRRC